MVEEKKKIIEKETNEEIKADVKVDDEKKVDEKKAVKKKEIAKKEFAVANAYSLKISPKQSKFVCRVIKRKSPEAAVKRLQEVIDEKRPVPMAGLEVGHKKGKGLAGGKWPKNACRAIMEIVKQAGANAVVAGIENPVITIAKADRAAAPYRRQGQKAKRTHIHIEVKDKSSLIKKKEDKGAKK
jgi:large subunit ribosomal protein L22